MRLLQREFWTSPDGRKVLLTLGGFAGTCVLILGFFVSWIDVLNICKLFVIRVIQCWSGPSASGRATGSWRHKM